MPVNSFENYPMSWKPKRPQGTKPIYLNIAEQLERDIKDGTITPNTMLPPQRELADYLDVNLSTVTRALKICALKGLLYGVVGRGTFVSPHAAVLEPKDNADITDLRYLETFPETSSYVGRAVTNIVNRPDFKQVMSYRNKTAEKCHIYAAKAYLSKLGLNADTDNIILCPGSQNALSIVLFSAFRAGDKIAADRYTYHNFKNLACRLSIQLVSVDTDEKGMLPAALEKQCMRNGIKGIYLMPVCQNPTSVTMPSDRRKELLTVIKRFGLTIIEDASNMFLDSSSEDSFYSLYGSTYFVMGTSKALCSGIRLAVLIYPDNARENIETSFSCLNLKMSSLDAEIFTELVNSNAYLKIISEKKRLLEERNYIFHKYFDNYSKYESPLSFFRWIELPEKQNVDAFLRSCLDREVIALSSDVFCVRSENKKFIRVALSSPDTPEKLDTSLMKLNLLLNGLN